MNKILILVILVILAAGGVYVFSQLQKNINSSRDALENTNAESQSNIPESFEENEETNNSEQEIPQEQTTGPSTYEIKGMKVEILKNGTGQASKTGDTVFVHYIGTLENGKKFDSSLDRGQPLSFTLGDNIVIEGWELGVLGMMVGEKRKLTIPPELAYGNQGAGGIIPPVSTLIFEVELVGIN